MTSMIAMNNSITDKGIKPLEMLGVGLVKLSKTSSYDTFEILFQKGIGIPLIQNISELYKKEVIIKKQGNSIIPLEEFTIYLNYFPLNEGDILIVILMDEKQNSVNYASLYLFTKRITHRIKSNKSIDEIIEFCNEVIQIPQTDGIIAVFIIGQNGSPFFSKINCSRTDIIKSEVQIGGFISALFSFSREIIGKERGAKLKEINFGNQQFYMINKSNTIFAYLVENLSSLTQRYMYLIADEFVERYHDHIIDFNGDVTRFYKFEEIVDSYFKIEQGG
jgi:hypothetical protein